MYLQTKNMPKNNNSDNNTINIVINDKTHILII